MQSVCMSDMYVMNMHAHTYKTTKWYTTSSNDYEHLGEDSISGALKLLSHWFQSLNIGVFQIILWKKEAMEKLNEKLFNIWFFPLKHTHIYKLCTTNSPQYFMF